MDNFQREIIFTLRQVTKTILTSTFRDIFTCLMSTSSYWYYIHFTDKLFVRRCFPGVSEETSCGYSSFGFYSLFLYSMVTQYKCTLLCSTGIVQYVLCTFASSVCWKLLWFRFMQGNFTLNLVKEWGSGVDLWYSCFLLTPVILRSIEMTSVDSKDHFLKVSCQYLFFAQIWQRFRTNA